MDWIEIMSTGTWISQEGKKITFTAGDLDNIAENFKPSEFEPPATVGHPDKSSAPAFGWVKELKRDGEKLLAKFEFVPEFMELLKKGVYRNRSVGLIGRTLNHVAFLGGKMPAITGLKSITFESHEEIESLTFESQESEMKEFYEKRIKELETQLAQFSGAEKDARLAEISKLKGELANFQALETENANLKKELDEEKTKKKNLETEQKKNEIKTFCEGLVKADRLTKAAADKAEKVLLAVSTGIETANFASGESIESVFKTLLSELPASGKMRNFATADNAAGKPEFHVDQFAGKEVDQESYATHERAVMLMKERNIDYKTAARMAVRGE